MAFIKCSGGGTLKPYTIPLLRAQVWSLQFAFKNFGYKSVNIGSFSGGDHKLCIRWSTTAPTSNSITSWTALATSSKTSGSDWTVDLTGHETDYIGLHKGSDTKGKALLKNIIFS
jgi:hypothetical protein